MGREQLGMHRACCGTGKGEGPGACCGDRAKALRAHMVKSSSPEGSLQQSSSLLEQEILLHRDVGKGELPLSPSTRYPTKISRTWGNKQYCLSQCPPEPRLQLFPLLPSPHYFCCIFFQPQSSLSHWLHSFNISAASQMLTRDVCLY